MASASCMRQDLQGATDKLYKFLTGWMGGPQLYVEQYGHPMLRAPPSAVQHLLQPSATSGCCA